MGMIEELKERIETKTPCLVFRAIEPSFQWETAVGYLQVCADSQAGTPIGLMSYRLPLADQIDSIKPVKNYLNENLDNEVIGVDMYINLTTKVDDKYTSKNDILLWNVIGYSDLELMGEQRVVEPGDLIYVPANTEYTFKPNTARVCVVFNLG